jgi:hypothetical protein
VEYEKRKVISEKRPGMNNQSPPFQQWQTRALITGASFTVISLFGLLIDRDQFFHSYLFAWLFWTGLPCGALVILTMQYLTGGVWGIALRSFAFAALRTLPLMALFFLPVLLGLRQIYGWASGAPIDSGGYHHKAQYLNAPFFIARFIIYFAVLILIAWFLRKWAAASEWRKVNVLSAGGLIAYVLCMNFASTDWVMSLDPAWYSTIFVEVFATGQFLAALAFTTWLFCAFSQFSLDETQRTKALHDLGNLLLAFVMFWTYVSFSQFLIIWSGNLPKEISWYLERSRGGWQWLALVLVLCQFALPFALLLSRAAKRNPKRLSVICICILLANLVSNFWFVAPSFHPRGFALHWLDATELIAIGGLWCSAFFHFLKQQLHQSLGSSRELQYA